MNYQISKFWNTFIQTSSAHNSSPKNILFSSNVPWHEFEENKCSALIIPLTQLESNSNPIPSIDDYLLLVDDSLVPHCVIKGTNVEVLPYLAIDLDMKDKLGNNYTKTNWKNYFARDKSRKQLEQEENFLVIYFEFKIEYFEK